MPSKAAHVLAKLREELGLHQKELAERVGLHWRTIQDIERGKLQLSRRNAIKIGEKLGVSPAWLLQNDTSQEIKNVSGEQWSLKDRQNTDAHYPWFAHRTPLVRQYILAGICVRLFRQYLRFRAYFDGLPDASKVLARWLECQEQAWSEFVASHEALAERTKNVPEEQTKVGRSSLRSIRDDIDAISEILWAIEASNEPFNRVFPREKWEEFTRLTIAKQPIPRDLMKDFIKAVNLMGGKVEGDESDFLQYPERTKPDKEAKTESADKAAQPAE
jgi:transcriptional regulator with XRE-family HTH domain